MDQLRLQITGCREGCRKCKVILQNGRPLRFFRTIYAGDHAVSAEVLRAAKTKLKISETEEYLLELAGTGESVSLGDILSRYELSCVRGGPVFPYPLAESSNSLELELSVYPPTAREVHSSGMSGCTLQLQKAANKGRPDWQRTAKYYAALYCSGSPGTGRRYLQKDNTEGATPLYWGAGLEQAVTMTVLQHKDQLRADPAGFKREVAGYLNQ